MSVMGFQKKSLGGGWVGGVSAIQFFLRFFKTFAKPLGPLAPRGAYTIHNCCPTSPVLGDPLHLLPAMSHLHDACLNDMSPGDFWVLPLSPSLRVPCCGLSTVIVCWCLALSRCGQGILMAAKLASMFYHSQSCNNKLCTKYLIPNMFACLQ